MSWKQGRLIQQFRRFLDIFISTALALIYATSAEPTLKAALGLLLFLLPGYSIAKFVLDGERTDFSSMITFTVVLTLCVMPLVGYLVQVVTFLSSYTILVAVLMLSVPLLLVSETKLMSKEKVEHGVNDGNHMLYKEMAFLGALAVGLGLYLQSSIGVVAPRGEDIYRHMYMINGMISTGKFLFIPDVNVVSNFYYFLYAELSLLTGLTVLSTGVLAQTMLGAIYAMSIFYFANYVTGKLTASFISSALFVAGPPFLTGGSTAYFWYFHPMWVGMSIFPFALAYIHKTLIDDENKNTNLSPLLISTAFLYHLAVGLMLVAILVLDFLLLLLKLRKKLLIVRFLKMLVLAFFVSLVLVAPFLLNVTNPFKYVYPEGGLQTLYSMFFAVSRYAFTSPSGGWPFFANMLSDFVKTTLPLLVVGVPGLIYLLIKRVNWSILILSCLFVGLMGVFQPWLGVSFVPQRFTSPLTMFGSTLIGASLSLIMVVPNIQIRKYGRLIKIKVAMSKGKLSGLTLSLLMLSYILLCTYLVFYSPAREAVLSAELLIGQDDLVALNWIDENTPRDSKILMDPYLQTFFAGIKGRSPLYSLTADKSFSELWGIYPVNVYIGETDPLKVDVDFIVISRWCYTTWYFVGKEYFDRHEGLKQLYEYQGSLPRGLYAVYQVTK